MDVDLGERQRGRADEVQHVDAGRRDPFRRVRGAPFLRCGVVLVAQQGLKTGHARRDLVGLDEHDRPLLQQVEKRRGLDRRRQVVLDAGERAVLAEPLDALGDIALEERIHEVEREALGQLLPRLARDREVRHRQHVHRARRFLGALRLDVEPAQRVDGVAEELDAQRLRGVRREDVEDAAAEGQLARLADEIGAHEAVLHELLEQRAHVELVAFAQADDAPGEVAGVRQAREECAHRDDQQVDAFLDQASEGVDLLAHHAERRRDVLVRRERRRRIRRHAARLTVEEAERRLEVADRGVAGDDDGQSLPQRLLQRRQEKRARLHRRAGDGDAALPVDDWTDERAKLRNERHCRRSFAPLAGRRCRKAADEGRGLPGFRPSPGAARHPLPARGERDLNATARSTR
jgi:hypothetical protein